MKTIALLYLVTSLALISTARAENHGLTITATASVSATTCKSTNTIPCTGTYNLYEGPTPAAELSTPINTTALANPNFTDDGPTMNAYLGTTRCYTWTFVESLAGGLILESVPSTEACFSFPNPPAPPTLPALAAH